LRRKLVEARIVALRQIFPAIIIPGLWCALAPELPAAETQPALKAKFTGTESCASTACHGGGAAYRPEPPVTTEEGLLDALRLRLPGRGRNEFDLFKRHDVHRTATGLLGSGKSQLIAQGSAIVGKPVEAAQCTVCHFPMQAVAFVAPERLAKDLAKDSNKDLAKDSKKENGVSCETCHGPAEKWLFSHRRHDLSYQQKLDLGLRDMIGIYERANACVACHLNIEEPIRNAGHPELFFELDGQTIAEPPHYKDERPSLGPRLWLTGQAVALREMSWKLRELAKDKAKDKKSDDRLMARWKAMLWLLQGKLPHGEDLSAVLQGKLPDGEDLAAVQSAADQLAQSAAEALWTKVQIAEQVRSYVSMHTEFNSNKDDPTNLRRAQILVPAIDRLWAAWKKESGVKSPALKTAFETALETAFQIVRKREEFEPATFAEALQKLDAVLKQIPSP
jgi:hypothetical protein